MKKGTSSIRLELQSRHPTLELRTQDLVILNTVRSATTDGIAASPKKTTMEERVLKKVLKKGPNLSTGSPFEAFKSKSGGVFILFGPVAKQSTYIPVSRMSHMQRRVMIIEAIQIPPISRYLLPGLTISYAIQSPPCTPLSTGNMSFILMYNYHIHMQTSYADLPVWMVDSCYVYIHWWWQLQIDRSLSIQKYTYLHRSFPHVLRNNDDHIGG